MGASTHAAEALQSSLMSCSFDTATRNFGGSSLISAKEYIVSVNNHANPEVNWLQREQDTTREEPATANPDYLGMLATGNGKCSAGEQEVIGGSMITARVFEKRWSCGEMHGH